MVRETKRSIHSDNYVALLGLGLTADQARQLQGIALRLHHLYECECNYGLTPRQEARERTLNKQVAEIAQATGLTIRTQGDPRGWPLEVYRDAARANGSHTPDLRVCPF